ncbi:hypothetical protein [uncultured Tateyamaria sp.]|uniref:hypothetical protein n=1 Tax=uncultured Tateyamaria sp. TaxID=455651 RepID=UPI002634D382|nr:hypothetical protein [uncultured Tateyamaria sp.]
MKRLTASLVVLLAGTVHAAASEPACGPSPFSDEYRAYSACTIDSDCDASAKYPVIDARNAFLRAQATAVLCTLFDGQERRFDDMVGDLQRSVTECRKDEALNTLIPLTYSYLGLRALSVEDRRFERRNGLVGLGERTDRLERRC